MAGFCGNIPLNLWEYLKGARVSTDEGCTALNLIQVPFGQCSMSCDVSQLGRDRILHSLFGLDSDGQCGIRVMVGTKNADGTCYNHFRGENEILNNIGTAADGKPALIITLSTP